METGQVDAAAAAALDLAGTYLFGADPGRTPAVLHEAYESAGDEGTRALLAAALARCWAYAGEHSRAVPFAAAALKHAAEDGDPVIRADALDAALATHWGPDELEVRRELAAKLADVAACLLAPDARTQAHIWLLTVAAETLDVAGMNRHMRALELLGEESTKARFYAASRRLMLDLMHGRTDTIEPLARIAEDALAQLELPDGFMVIACMRGYGACQSGNIPPGVVELARMGDRLAESEGIRVLYAEIAWIYQGLGMHEDARRLVETFDADNLIRLPRDYNYLLTLQLALDVALAQGLTRLVEAITPQLLPYAGRAVINAGAVMFHGVTDDPLSRACDLLGDHERARTLRVHALETYRRLGASWWAKRLAAVEEPAGSIRTSGESMTLRPGPAGVWLVGHDGSESPVPARRGLEHLHTLLANAGHEVPATQLAGALVDQSDLGPTADRAALGAYRRRLVELDAELDRADEWADVGMADRLAAEREALLVEIAAATGLAGRTRPTGSSAERARVTVRKAISAAIQAIDAADPVVVRHLTAHVHTGQSCIYEPSPDRPVTWQL
ncbi:hypothetical protein [Nocardioides sp.]|uniref:hypothetical protein n=1 Tax=Nocardioides sp. TaxID=35761 RepID=UPI0026193E7B|nr:hypothetical protein [Nocardioides sp.]